VKAILLAAGLGTRLMPITKNTPKALVKIQGKPLIQHQLEKLKANGFTEVLINVHHFGNQIIDFLNIHNNFGLKITISDEKDKLLDTGGALKKASDFILGNEAVLIHNVDVIGDLALKLMMETHIKSGALATLAVRKRDSSRYLYFDAENKLCGWENLKSGEKKGECSRKRTVQAAFSGIHIISPKFIELFPSEEKFSIIDLYVSLSKSHSILAYFHDDNLWFDVGTHESLAKAEKIKF
jgi:NDP-sugar pyrophosphorylase family protein